MNEDLKRWDESAREWAGTNSGYGKFRFHLIAPQLEKILGNGGGKELLDAGCGDGIYTNFATERGFHAVGIDGSAEMVALAHKNYPKLEFKQADLMELLPFGDESFDVVLSILVLMSLSDIRTFLNESHRVLKSHGQLIIVVRHPTFSNPVMSLYKTILDKVMFKKPKGLIENYFLNKQDRRAWEKDKTWNIPYYPRTLEQYSNEFVNSGFIIGSMHEPNTLPLDYLKQFPKLEYVTRLPRFLFFKLIKQ